MGKTFQDWLAEGNALYQAALQEYQDLEAQIVELEQKLAVKRDEVNEIARVVSKEPIEASRRPSAEIVERGQPNSVPNSPNTIVRALTGRGLGR